MSLVEPIKTSRHGFVRYVDHMGDDSSIVQAARVSYGDGTKSVREDAALIEHLIENGHTSPLEMVELKLHISCTIFEARQFVRHRTASWSELSGRYSVVPGDFWYPEPHEVRGQGSGRNKQAADGIMPFDEQTAAASCMKNVMQYAYGAYESLLAAGVGREQARALLPQSMYTQFYWKIDGNNLLKVLALRDDSHAQKETREMAIAIKQIAWLLWPQTCAAADEWLWGSVKLSKTEVVALREIMEYEIAKDSEARWTLAAQALGDWGTSEAKVKRFMGKVGL